MRQPGKIKKQNDEDDFCPRCGLIIAGKSQEGAWTSFLFSGRRCRCKADLSFADGQMSRNFKTLKQKASGTTFNTDDNASGHAESKNIDLIRGATIGGAYQIIELIGCGGMGEVYLARHSALGKKCALKVIPPEQVTEMGWLRFQQEAKAVAQLEHINLVRVTDLGIHEGCLPFYAMDYVNGKNLSDLLAESGPLSVSTVLEIFMQVCDGVEYAHRHGILHRDLKPANIMIEQIPNHKFVAKVLDFGLAKLSKQDRTKQSLTAVGDIFGSPFYMSPEQCAGDKLDSRSDVYSLGCTMFECLTGQPPFSGNLPTAVMFSHQEADPPALEDITGAGRFPRALEVVMAKLLRKNPAERYQNLVELRGDLERVARGESVEPYYASRAKQTQTYQSDDTEKVSTRAVQSKNILLWTIVAAMVSGISLYFLRPGQKVDKKVSETTESNIALLDKNSGTDKRSAGLSTDNAVSTKDTAPFSSLVKGPDGQPCKLFKFPADKTLGTIEIGIDTYLERNKKNTFACRGDVLVPLGQNMIFIPHAEFYAHPEYITRLRADDFDAVTFEETAEPGEPVPTNAIINQFTRLSGLKEVRIFACHLLDDTALRPLEKLPKLRKLLIMDTPISLNAIANLPFLQKLESLKIQPESSPTFLLGKLRNSPNLEYLSLLHYNLTTTDFKLIATMKNLKYLYLSYCLVNNEDLAILSTLDKLVHLSIHETDITVDAAPTIQKMIKHGLKILDVSSSHMTVKTFNALKQSCPGATIN